MGVLWTAVNLFCTAFSWPARGGCFPRLIKEAAGNEGIGTLTVFINVPDKTPPVLTWTPPSTIDFELVSLMFE